MKASRIISFILITAIMILSCTSCANPNGSANTNVQNPPGSSATKDTKIPDPVDMSVLTEDEQGKLKYGLLDKIKGAEKNDTLSVDIFLKKPLTSAEYEKEVRKRLDQNPSLFSEEQRKEYESLSEKQNSPLLSTKEKEEVSQQIDALYEAFEAENKRYMAVVNDILDEYAAITNKYIADYNLKIPHEMVVADRSMLIGSVLVTAQELVILAQDERTETIQVAEATYDEVCSMVEEMVNGN